LVQRLARGESRTHRIQDLEIPCDDSRCLHEEVYEPSPYVDFNGARLLYFATYPTLSDNCERAYVNEAARGQRTADWAVRASTRARHVFYFANLNLGESVAVRIHYSQAFEDVHLFASSIVRLRDQRRMARIFTVKSLVPTG
jgi:probable biosynthetic protein (TIGR04098 family)